MTRAGACGRAAAAAAGQRPRAAQAAAACSRERRVVIGGMLDAPRGRCQSQGGDGESEPERPQQVRLERAGAGADLGRAAELASCVISRPA